MSSLKSPFEAAAGGVRVAAPARDGKANEADQELLEGLVNLTDAIADQAHDKHGIDCLLDESPPT